MATTSTKHVTEELPWETLQRFNTLSPACLGSPGNASVRQPPEWGSGRWAGVFRPAGSLKTHRLTAQPPDRELCVQPLFMNLFLMQLKQSSVVTAPAHRELFFLAEDYSSIYWLFVPGENGRNM